MPADEKAKVIDDKEDKQKLDPWAQMAKEVEIEQASAIAKNLLQSDTDINEHIINDNELNNRVRSNELMEAKYELASALHEDWRKSRLTPDGTFEPRLKATTDQKWIDMHDGTTEVDIANTAFEDLPIDWKMDNLEAAIAAVDIVDRAKSDDRLEDIEALSSEVHDAWIKRQLIKKGLDPADLDSIYISNPAVAEAFKDDSWTADLLVEFKDLTGDISDESSLKGKDALHIRLAKEKLGLS